MGIDFGNTLICTKGYRPVAERRAIRAILYKKRIELKRFGNEVYYTNSAILLVKNMLCGEINWPKVFNFIHFTNVKSQETRVEAVAALANLARSAIAQRRYTPPTLSSPRRVLLVSTIPPQGIAAMCLVFKGKAPMPCRKSYSS